MSGTTARPARVNYEPDWSQSFAVFDALAQRMGTLSRLRSENRYVPRAGLYAGAQANGNHVDFDPRLFEKIGLDDREAMMAHEFGHLIDTVDTRMRWMGALALAIIPAVVAVMELPRVIGLWGIIAGFAILFVLLRLSFQLFDLKQDELRADVAGAKAVGRQRMITALTNSYEAWEAAAGDRPAYLRAVRRLVKWVDTVHPPISYRIHCLEALTDTETCAKYPER